MTTVKCEVIDKNDNDWIINVESMKIFNRNGWNNNDLNFDDYAHELNDSIQFYDGDDDEKYVVMLWCCG